MHNTIKIAFATRLGDTRLHTLGMLQPQLGCMHQHRKGSVIITAAA
jgi:hypothetical protein